jgi:hypothetical protein
MNENIQIVSAALASPVGRVSAKRVTRQEPEALASKDVLTIEEVGLRCANPTYGAEYVFAYREMWDMPDEVVLGGGA